MIDDLIFGTATKDHVFYKIPSAFVAIDALIEMNRSTSLTRAIENTDKLLKRAEDDSIDMGSAFTLRNKDIAEGVSASSRKIVCSWLEKAEYNFMTNAVKRVILVDLAKTSALKRLSKLTPEDMARLTGPLPTETLYQRYIARAPLKLPRSMNLRKSMIWSSIVQPHNGRKRTTTLRFRYNRGYSSSAKETEIVEA